MNEQIGAIAFASRLLGQRPVAPRCKWNRQGMSGPAEAGVNGSGPWTSNA